MGVDLGNEVEADAREIARRRRRAGPLDPIEAGPGMPQAGGPRASGAEPDPDTSGQRGGRRLVTVDAADVVEQPVRWLWRHRLLEGALNLFEGRPEAGKSSIILDLISRMSSGQPFPDGAPGPRPLSVKILGAEDALESIVRPRLRVAGADLARITFITGALDDDDAYPGRVILPRDLYLLALELAGADLLYLDGSINDLAERTVRAGDDVAMREILGGLHELARRTNRTVLASRHNRKGGSKDPQEFGSGTVGIMAKARNVFGVYRDPHDPEQRLLARVKCNVSPALVPTLACRFESDEPDGPLHVRWASKPDPRSALEILGESTQAEAGGAEDHSAASRALVDWLRDGQPKAVVHLKDLARQGVLTWKAYEWAKDKLGIKSVPLPGGGWAWRDPFFASRERES